MHKPIVFNRHLNEQWSLKTNELMVNKLKNVKPMVNMKCPESFYFYKTQFHKTAARNNRLKQYEIDMGNQNLLRKLMDVSTECKNREMKRRTPIFEFKKNFMTSNKKYEIIRVAQENQHMLKRIQERGSFYNVSKWEKDYEKSQYYKRNHCIFPSIDFYKTQRGSSFNSRGYGTYSNRTGFGQNKYSTYDRFVYDRTKSNNSIQEENKKNDEEDQPHVLYKTQSYLTGLGECNIEFSVQTQNFTIKVEALNDVNKSYAIIFDSRESVENIQKYYKKYDEMIADLDYDEAEDIVKFNNTDKSDLNCKCIKLPPREEVKEEDKKENENNGEMEYNEPEEVENKEENKEEPEPNKEEEPQPESNKEEEEKKEPEKVEDVKPSEEEKKEEKETVPNKDEDGLVQEMNAGESHRNNNEQSTSKIVIENKEENVEEKKSEDHKEEIEEKKSMHSHYSEPKVEEDKKSIKSHHSKHPDSPKPEEQPIINNEEPKAESIKEENKSNKETPKEEEPIHNEEPKPEEVNHIMEEEKKSEHVDNKEEEKKSEEVNNEEHKEEEKLPALEEQIKEDNKEEEEKKLVLLSDQIEANESPVEEEHHDE